MKHLQKTHAKNHLKFCLASLLAFMAGINISTASSVSDISAAYRNGQVFITWTNPREGNLQYNIYRSTIAFTNVSQFNESTLMGYVYDNSARNLRLSINTSQSQYYKIEDGGLPLNETQGLYVITCNKFQSFYYAVTVTDLTTGIESKSIMEGRNVLALPVEEEPSRPQPVFQDSIITVTHETKFLYVQFVNNQETSWYPAMNSTGSYAFNFYISKRGNAFNGPLYILYEGISSDPHDGTGLESTISNCYIIGLDDWLPIPNGNGSLGDNTYFCCYHENFNIYSNENPIPETGTVKAYSQRRCISAIRWAKHNFPIDSTRVYAKGSSATGFGALLTAIMYPTEIAAVYCQVEPTLLKPSKDSEGEIYKQMWGVANADLESDVTAPTTDDSITVYTLLDLRKMLNLDRHSDLPPVFDVHGKYDTKVIWSAATIDWFDSLQSNHIGGAFYWDLRNHDGSNKSFLGTEVMPDFLRFQTTKSYPAFSNCTINQDPGNGGRESGDTYGAINGYLDWDDNIVDEKCNYAIKLRIKDFYVGGELDPEQYYNCYTDITFRRLQSFRPPIGATVEWNNYNQANSVIQSGSFVYTGELITLGDIRINKGGNRLEMHIPDCKREDMRMISQDQSALNIRRIPGGYQFRIPLTEEETVTMQFFNTIGQVIKSETHFLAKGMNVVDVPLINKGVCIVQITGKNFLDREKLIF